MTEKLTACQPSDMIGLERTRFFPRQLVAPDDLTQDQIYFREKFRRHNRLLHGWGVVCGVRVKAGQDLCQIIVEPGYVLGPFGDEIVIEAEVTVDLCREGLDGNAVSPCGDLLDPWCSDVRVDRPTGQKLYVAVRYAECQARPVRVTAGGCGCDETACEYSRVRDSYAIKVLSKLPGTYSDPMPQPSSDNIITCARADNQKGRGCPPCPTEPWVILADVTMTADGQLAIDCFAHRRYVASFADYYFLCREQDGPVIGPGGVVRPSVATNLVDTSAEGTGATPAANVTLRRADDSWAVLPFYATVQPGENLAAFLAREGGRSLYDPATGETYTLAELYTLAGADPEGALNDVADAVAPLEGLRLKVADLRLLRAGLADLLDNRGIKRLDERHLGAPGAAPELPASDLAGVNPRSTLGRKLANRTVADVAGLSRADFLAEISQDVPANQRKEVERQAGEIWSRATRVTNLGRAWRGE